MGITSPSMAEAHHKLPELRLKSLVAYLALHTFPFRYAETLITADIAHISYRVS